MINGAIGAGKDTVSVALAGLLEKDGRRVAVVGLDELWAMIDHQQPRRGDLASWLLARRGAAALADLFYLCGCDDVIVNGPFFSSAERSGFLDHLATPVVPRFFTLRVSFEESLRRVREDDHPRGMSRDRTFLAERFAVSEALLQAIAPTDLVINTDRRAPNDIAHEIHSALAKDLQHARAASGPSPSSSLVVHIAERAGWQEAERRDEYRARSLESNGFIHFSLPEQVIRVANAIYRARTDLVLLWVDPALLTHVLRMEDGGAGELFPHLYGPLNTGAVIRTELFPPDADGTFRLPR